MIIEDLRELRDGLVSLINYAPGFVCVAACRTMEEALLKIEREVPDVVLSDIGLPKMDGIQGIRIIKEKHPEVTVLMLTVYDDDDRIFDSICAGASGYLLKHTHPLKLLEALTEAVSGGAPMSPEVAGRVITFFRQIRPPSPPEHDLTPHETRILKMIVEGHNYTTAAEELNVKYSTIKFHMQNIYDKLQVHSKSEAVAKALRDGIVS